MGSKTPEAMILYHESKHNILAFVSKANRAHNVAHQKIDETNMKLHICTYKIESTNIQIITNYSSTTRKAQVVLDRNSIPLQI